MPIDRRLFLKTAAVGACSALVPSFALSGCTSQLSMSGSTQTVTDSVGRRVTLPIPRRIESIYFTSPLAQIFCFTMAPDLLAGTSMRFTSEQLAYLPEKTADLPYLGSLSNGGSIDTEALDYMGVQAVFSISGVGLTDVNVDDALRLERQTGIPAVLIDGSFGVMGDTYRMLGQCLGREERGSQLARYCEEAYERVVQAVARVPESERVRYYFAEGADGLSTESDESQHSVAFNVAGGVNVAASVSTPGGVEVMVPVSVEQLKEWDPHFVIVWDSQNRAGAASLIRNSAEWSGIDAVRNNRVFEMPSLPFAFCDRPPGVNRVLGVQWLANLFYPRYYDVDMVEVVRKFYEQCYWRSISDSQARSILGESYGRQGL